MKKNKPNTSVISGYSPPVSRNEIFACTGMKKRLNFHLNPMALRGILFLRTRRYSTATRHSRKMKTKSTNCKNRIFRIGLIESSKEINS